MRTLIRFLRAPLWVLALGTGAKSFVDNPILGSERLNKFGLHAARLKLAHSLAASRRRRLASKVPAHLREQFDRDGFLEIRNFLGTEEFSSLREALLSHEFDVREHQQGNATTRRVAFGPRLVRQIPELHKLLHDRSFHSILAYGASTSARPIYYIQAILMGHSEGTPDPQLELHADTFQPSLKGWLFLTDVTDDEGPLTYVPGSHRLTRERLEWERQRSISIRSSDRLSQRGSLRIQPEELPKLGLPAPKRFAVPANTFVMIDTCGFHARGSCTKPSIRAEIWAYVRRAPFVPWTGMDLLSFGPIGIRRGGLMLQIVDFLEKLGMTKQHWRHAGRKRVLDI